MKIKLVTSQTKNCDIDHCATEKTLKKRFTVYKQFCGNVSLSIKRLFLENMLVEICKV